MIDPSIALAARTVASTLFASLLVGQTILSVPGTHPSITAAIAAAPLQLLQPVVIDVAPGTYFESLAVGLDGLVIRRAPGATGDVVVRPPLGSHAVDFLAGVPLSRATRIEDIKFIGNLNPSAVSLVVVNGQSPTMVRCSMSDNESFFAGGIWVRSPATNTAVGPLFVDCDIARNIAVDGGGAEVEANARFEACRFTGNNASDRGAGIFVSTNSEYKYDVDLVDCVLSGNGQVVAPVEGGAFHVHTTKAALRFFGSRLQNNRAQSGGAGVSRGRGLQMDHCVAIGNTASSGEAGGVLIETGFDANDVEISTGAFFTSTKLIANVASSRGGALLVRRTGTDPAVKAELVMANCLVANNIATGGQGGGVFAERASTLLARCTVANNNAAGASGRGIFAATSDSFVGLTTCILWGNVGGLQRNQIAGATGAGIVALFSDVQNNGGAAFPGLGNINLVPQFVMVFGVPENSYYLQATSPCINTGEPGPLDGSESVLSNLLPDVGVPDMGYHRNAMPVPALLFP